jgi:hypothetical protein
VCDKLHEQYFIQRDQMVKGPYSLATVERGLASGKLRESDRIAANESGPWQTLGRWISRKQRIRAGKAISQKSDDLELLDDLVELTRNTRPTAGKQDKASTQDSPRRSIRQWIEHSGVEVDWDVLFSHGKKLATVLGGIAAAGVAMWFGLPMASYALRETVHQVNEFREAVAQIEVLQPEHVAPNQRDDQSLDPGDVAGNGRLAAHSPKHLEQHVAEPTDRTLVGKDHDQMIRQLLQEYYGPHTSWRTRHPLCVEEPETMNRMKIFYGERAIPDVLEDIGPLPPPDTLREAAQAHSPVGISVKVDGESTSQRVVFDGSRWKIVWSHVWDSHLSSLGITRPNRITILVDHGTFERRDFHTARVLLQNPLKVPLWATIRLRSNIMEAPLVDTLLYDIKPGETKSTTEKFRAAVVFRELWEDRTWSIDWELKAKGFDLNELMEVDLIVNDEDFARYTTIPKNARLVKRSVRSN